MKTFLPLSLVFFAFSVACASTGRDAFLDSPVEQSKWNSVNIDNRTARDDSIYTQADSLPSSQSNRVVSPMPSPTPSPSVKPPTPQ